MTVTAMPNWRTVLPHSTVQSLYSRTDGVSYRKLLE